MKSVKEVSMSGLDYFERKELLKTLEPIPIGSVVYQAGGPFEYTKQVVVTKENQELVSLGWNAMFFPSIQEAELKTSIQHAEYSEYQERASMGALY